MLDEHLSLSPVGESKPLLLNVEAAAAVLGIGRTKLYELLKEGELRAVSVGRRRLVSIGALNAFVARLESESQ